MAYEEFRTGERACSAVLEGRARLTLTGVSDVESFDEREIAADTAEGELVVTGEGLHVERLSLESGELIVNGRIDGVEYLGERRQKGSLWSRLF